MTHNTMGTKTDPSAEKIIARYCRMSKLEGKTSIERKFAIERYMHRRKGREGTLTVEEWRAICQQYDNRCHWCGEKITEMSQEHLRPKSQGGGFTKENIVPACVPCNNGRGERQVMCSDRLSRPE